MIIIKEEEFREAEALVNKIFDLKQSLPNQVFKEGFGNFTFEEFNWTESKEFWDTSLQILGQTFNDTEILVMMIDSDLQDFYFRNFGFYTAMKMPLTFSGEDYWRELHTGPQKAPHEIPYDGSDKVVWCSLSGKWAIWGQRSYETCVLAFADTNFAVPEESLKATWRSVDKALVEFICLSYYKQHIPEKDFVAFLSNYSNKTIPK